MKIAPPTLLPKRADVLPILFTYELIINFVVLRLFWGGNLVIPIIPPTKNDATYDGPMVAESVSVNMLNPGLSIYSSSFGL